MIIIAAGCALRFWGLGAQSFWSDELQTASHLHQSLSALIGSVTETETTPYLYFVLIKGWTVLFGSSEASVRSFSALAGVATLLVVALIAKELWSRRAALLAALLTATNPLLIWYAQEARAYALFVLVSAIALLYFTRAVQRPGLRNVWLWGIWSAIALMTHYFAILWIVIQAGYLCLLEHRRNGGGHTALMVSGLLVLIAIPVGVLANHQRLATGYDPRGGPFGSPLTARAGNIPKEYFLGPPQPCLTRPGRGCTGPSGNRSFALIAVLVMLALGSYLGPTATRCRKRLPVLIMTGGAAVGAPWVLALLGADFVDSRNVISWVVPFTLIVAGGAAISRLGLVGGLAIAAVGVLSVLAVHSNRMLQRADYRGLASRTGAPGVNRAIVMTPGMSGDLFNVYWHGARLMMPGQTAKVGEIDVAALDDTFYGHPPAIRPTAVPAGFNLVQGIQESDYTLLRYRRLTPVLVSWSTLVALHGSGVYVQP